MNKEKLVLFIKRGFRSFIWLGVLLLGLDIMSKLIVAANRTYIINLMATNGHGIILIPNFFAISYVENPAAAFGLGGSNWEINRWVYVAVATIICAAIIVFYCLRHARITKYVKACLMMILAGALGNMVDRLFYGFANHCVIDWINFYGIWKWNFNIADSCIVIAAIMLIVWLIVMEVKESNAKKKVQLEEAVNADNSTLENDQKSDDKEDKISKENEPSVEDKKPAKKKTKKSVTKAKSKSDLEKEKLKNSDDVISQ